MPESTDFSEGDPISVFPIKTLFVRLSLFLRPYVSQVMLASCLILACIGMELALPYIMRTAIDTYLLPYWVNISHENLPREFKKTVFESLPGRSIISHEDQLYLPVKHFRELDPALLSRLRKTNAVDTRHWYASEITGKTNRVFENHSDLFVKTPQYLMITDEHLKLLSKNELSLLRRSDANGLVMMAFLFSSVTAMVLITSYFHTIFLEKAGQKMMMDLRLELYRHILSRSLLFFSKHPVGKLVTRLNNDIQGITELFRNMLMGLFKDLFMFTGIVIVMFILNARLSVVCILVAPFMAGIAWFFARMTKKISHMIKGATGRINTLLQETVSGMTAVKLLGAESTMTDKLNRLNTSHFHAGLSQVKMFAVFTPLMEFLGSITIALIIWYGGGIVIQDQLSLGTLVAFITYMQMMLVPVRDLSEKYNRLQDAVAGAERIFTILDDQTDLSTAEISTAAIHPLPNAIRFQSVCFGYHDSRKIIENFDLLIPAGQTVTLVGPSGGGKSTLVNLLLRLYDPLEGAIQLGNRDLTTISPKEIARRIALVSQEIILLSASIEENVLLGRKDISQEIFSEALYISGISVLVDDLPEGINTRIGEGGRQLSVGETQMLSLARALVGDPQILMLDEAFSHIDPENENRIISRLLSMMSNRILIIVAHRLSTARHSDRILVIRNGRIEEDGDHLALMRSRGVYADMVSLDRMETANEKNEKIVKI